MNNTQSVFMATLLCSVSLFAHANTMTVMTAYKGNPNSFLSPSQRLEQSIVNPSSDHSLECQSLSTIDCPESLQPGSIKGSNDFRVTVGRSSRGLPGPMDEVAIEQPKNLRVTFILDSMKNSAISGGGIETAGEDAFSLGIWNTWKGNSSAATVERYLDEAGETGEVGLPLPYPGETWEIPHANVLYDAIVVDGCGNVPVFPIEWQSTVVDVDNFNAVYGEFNAFDDSTLTPTGYFIFDYTVRAMDSDGNESDFRFTGRVQALCTNMESFL